MRFFRVPFNSDDESGSADVRSNRLQKYIHAQTGQDMSRLASEISPEVRQIIASNVQALLGYLPNNDFNTTVVASKENLQNLLASAMLTGYFMHAMEMRMQMDDLLGEPEAPGHELGPVIGAEMPPVFGPEPAPEADEPAGEGADSLLRHPESLFRLPAEDAPEPRETGFGEMRAALGAEGDGRFLDAREFGEAGDERSEALSLPEEPAGDAVRGRISGRLSEKFDIQLEINTRMNRAELARLLRELREFQADEPEL